MIISWSSAAAARLMRIKSQTHIAYKNLPTLCMVTHGNADYGFPRKNELLRVSHLRKLCSFPRAPNCSTDKVPHVQWRAEVYGGAINLPGNTSSCTTVKVTFQRMRLF
jgi:hypothetical protein